MNYRLPKSERLHSEKLIKELFSEGSSFFLYPFKVLYKIKAQDEALVTSVLFSIPKKRIRKANDRNLLRRRIKEAYRLNKHKLTAPPIHLGLVYVGKEDMAFADIQAKLILVLQKLNLEFSDTP